MGGRSMSKGGTAKIDYSALVEGALRGVVREVLAEVATGGLPGRHHLYLTFRTGHPEVVMPDTLRARYPTDMTIVLQHEFWGLEVDDHGFAVTLSFSNAPQRLEVPFEALTVFADPSVEFGLQFSAPEADSEATEGEATDEQGRPAPVEPLPLPASASRPSGGGEVVTLDRFRKK